MTTIDIFVFSHLSVTQPAPHSGSDLKIGQKENLLLPGDKMVSGGVEQEIGLSRYDIWYLVCGLT